MTSIDLLKIEFKIITYINGKLKEAGLTAKVSQQLHDEYIIEVNQEEEEKAREVLNSLDLTDIYNSML